MITRTYHAVNTKYNVYFNAEEAYKAALKGKIQNYNDNLSELIYVYPFSLKSDSSENSGNFTTTIDKCTKAIKLHSIKVKPRRNPSKRRDESYRNWLKQQEFNPFLKNVWLLLGKAEYESGDYLRSITTFLYTTKIYSTNPDIVAECQLRMAKAYMQMDWMYEAGIMISNVERMGLPNSQRDLYAEVNANFLVRSGEYAKSIPYLKMAIKGEKVGEQKLRLKYLLGQLYALEGNKINAVKAFSDVRGMNTPYHFAFNSLIREYDLYEIGHEEKVLKELNRMAKSRKNNQYQDQIYYTIGNIYLGLNDTIKAIDNYKLAVDSSSRSGYDKTMAQVKLADLYFEKRQFVMAQPYYSDALSGLKKTDRDYPRVALRSDVLDELVVHVKMVHEQDSLQYVASLPEENRIKLIEDKIKELKRLEDEQVKEEKRKQQQENRNSQVSDWGYEPLFQSSSSDVNTPLAQNSFGSDASFYFYNPQVVSQGKVGFQKQWGNRKLEDDWRRKNKTVSPFGSFEWEEIHAENNVEDSLQINEGSSSQLVEDIYSVDYYLQQLPLTEEAVQASNVLIENALFNQGLIYKNKLEDTNLAIDAFETDLSRFPQTPNLEEICYQLFLIYMQLGDREKMSMYRNRLLNEFSVSVYARTLSDDDYEWNLRHMYDLQDSIYTATYDAYLRGDVATVRKNYETINSKYPLSALMPKFLLLNALSYTQTRDIEGLEVNLKELIKKYPKDDVTPFAAEMLEHIKDGQILLSDGEPIRSIDWSKAYQSEADESVHKLFSDSLDSKYILLLAFAKGTVDRNELLFQIADYNFSNYVVHTYDLSFESIPPFDVLEIKGFENFNQIKSYINRSFGEGGLIHKIDTSIVAIPITVENMAILPVLGLERYTAFVKNTYKNLLPHLMTYLDGHREILNEMQYEDTNLAEIGIDEPDDGEQNEETEIPAVISTNQIEQNLVQSRIQQELQRKEKEKLEAEKREEQALQAHERVGDGLNEAIEVVQKIKDNPVEGLKNLFSGNKIEDNLTKEEKAEWKKEQKLRGEMEKEQKARLKVSQDSIADAEKAVQDSIKLAEKRKIDEEKRLEKERQDLIKAKKQEKERMRKQREKEREERRKAQERKRKDREKERKERLKVQEKERNK